jgi:hypothetical protein
MIANPRVRIEDGETPSASRSNIRYKAQHSYPWIVFYHKAETAEATEKIRYAKQRVDNCRNHAVIFRWEPGLIANQKGHKLRNIAKPTEKSENIAYSADTKKYDEVESTRQLDHQ